MRDDYLPPDIEANNDNRSAQVIQIDSGKHLSVVAICSALCGLSAALSMWAANEARIAEREARMLQNYVVELDAKLIHAGFIEPKETWTVKRKQETKR